jgi:hypothetical protein
MLVEERGNQRIDARVVGRTRVVRKRLRPCGRRARRYSRKFSLEGLESHHARQYREEAVFVL